MELLNAKDVSKILKCSIPLVYKMKDRKQLASVSWKCPGTGKAKPRTCVRFKLSDVQDFIEKHYTTT